MKKLLYSLFSILVLLSLFACGGGDSFRISGEITGIGTQNLNIVYYGDGAVKTLRTAVVDGKFMFDGSSRDWTTVYIFNSRRALIGLVIVRNGESVQAYFDVNEPEKVALKGNKPSQLLSSWLAQYATEISSDSPEAVNAAVKDFVTHNTSNIASTVVLLNYYRDDYNLSEADSLLRIIDAKARPAYMVEGWSNLQQVAADSANIILNYPLLLIDLNDSLRTLTNNEGLVWIYLPTNEKRDAKIDSLLADRYSKIGKDSLKITFVEIDRYVSDTAVWKKSVRNDSLSWLRLWHPFNTHSLPVQQSEIFLVADTAGKVLYRGNDVWQAIKTVNVY